MVKNLAAFPLVFVNLLSKPNIILKVFKTLFGLMMTLIFKVALVRTEGWGINIMILGFVAHFCLNAMLVRILLLTLRFVGIVWICKQSTQI
jgi:hypothetical protein